MINPMTALQAVLLAIIEGLTEFLPVSSTGHLLLAGKALGIPDTDFSKTFDIVIQFGAILAVVSLYWKTVLSKPKLLIPVLTAFLPTAVVGMVLYPFIKTVLLESSGITVISLALGGIVLLFIDRVTRPDTSKSILTMPLFHAFIIGLGQSAAVVPGVSRAAATMVAALLLGYPKKTAVEFSFLLAVPTIGAAAGYDAVQNIPALKQNLPVLAIGFAGAWISAVFAVRGFVAFLNSHSLAAFGWYRIVLASLYFLIIGV